MPNQDPEQLARDIIDKHLIACGWDIQDKDKINLNANCFDARAENELNEALAA